MSQPLDAPAIELATDLDLVAAATLKEQLIEAIDRDGRVVLNASSVERLTTPCAQVLVAAARSLADQGNDLTVETPSEAFVAAFSDLGLGAVLQHWMETK